MLNKLFSDRVHGKSINIVMLSAIGAMCAGFLMNGLSPKPTSAENAQQEVGPEATLMQAQYASLRQEPKERENGYEVFVDSEYIATISERDTAMFKAYLAGRLNESIKSEYSSAYYSNDIELVEGMYVKSDISELEEVINLLFEEDENGERLVTLETNYVTYTEDIIPYETIEVSNPLLPKGESFVSQEGQEGTSVITSLVSETDGEIVKTVTVNKAVTKQPVTKVIEVGTATFSNLIWPVGAGGGYVSSDYGHRDFDESFHKGLDICGVPEGSDIYAVYAGTVIRSETNQNGYGEFIVIDHGNGYHTAYAHLSERDVQIGDKVLAGDRIGGIGTTGQSTGVHLHFEIRYGSEFANPNDFLA